MLWVKACASPHPRCVVVHADNTAAITSLSRVLYVKPHSIGALSGTALDVKEPRNRSPTRDQLFGSSTPTSQLWIRRSVEPRYRKSCNYCGLETVVWQNWPACKSSLKIGSIKYGRWIASLRTNWFSWNKLFLFFKIIHFLSWALYLHWICFENNWCLLFMWSGPKFQLHALMIVNKDVFVLRMLTF